MTKTKITDMRDVLDVTFKDLPDGAWFLYSDGESGVDTLGRKVDMRGFIGRYVDYPNTMRMHDGICCYIANHTVVTRIDTVEILFY